MSELTITSLISSVINLPGGTRVAIRDGNGDLITEDIQLTKVNDKLVIEKMEKKIKFPVLEIFTSVQGEGMYTGYPSVFVRVAGCNLRCVFGNSRCDTPYSSFELEKPISNDIDEVVELVGNELMKNPNVKHLVITGGEPLLYKDAIKLFYSKLQQYDLTLTIETNGTLEAFGVWNDEEWDYYVDLWSVSPKLSTSVDHNCKYLTESQRDNHNKTRINYDNLASYWEKVRNTNNYMGDVISSVQYKFVYSGEDSVIEIKEILNNLSNEYNIPLTALNDHVMLMPEGTTNDQLEKISQECAEVCIREGWRFCDRLHIRIWGDKRGV